MKTTTNYGLKKPDGTDAVDIADFNENADIIDGELAKKIDKTGAVSDMTVKFTQSVSRVNLTPGEKISTAFGKISKFFVDLKTVAFSGNYNDLINKPSIPSGGAATKGVANNCTTNVDGYVLDARQGKHLQDQVNVVNSNLLRYENGAAQVGTGVTKQITLKSAYTELHSFNITCFDQAGRGFALAGLEIFPPSTVKFQMLASTGIAEGPYLVGYYFVGK